MNIGIFINFKESRFTGGGFSYENKMIYMIDNYSFNNCNNIFFIVDSRLDNIKLNKEHIFINYQTIYNSYWTFKKKIIRRILSLKFLNRIGVSDYATKDYEVFQKNYISNKLLSNGIDTIYFITPGSIDYNIPYISTHWDLGHLSMYSFPEVIMNGKFENRENYHRIILRKSIAIITESERSINELMKYEGVNPKKMWKMPMFPGEVIGLNIDESKINQIINKYSLTKYKFFFYPAQFWAHKNHYTLILAFNNLIKLSNYSDFKLVLSGSDAGSNMDYIKDIVEKLGISKSVIFTGFVDNEYIYSFYKSTCALVMPTLLGPTNMPLLEAYYLECPVICSDLEGHREIMNENAWYIDPLNQEDILEKMLQVIENKDQHINKKITNKIFENTMEILDNILVEINKIRRLYR